MDLTNKCVQYPIESQNRCLEELNITSMFFCCFFFIIHDTMQFQIPNLALAIALVMACTHEVEDLISTDRNDIFF